VANGARTHGL